MKEIAGIALQLELGRKEDRVLPSPVEIPITLPKCFVGITLREEASGFFSLNSKLQKRPHITDTTLSFDGLESSC